MKHSRSEIVKTIVSSYMRRRQYTENETVNNLGQPLVRNREGIALSGIVDMESSFPNSIAYKCVQNDPSVSEAQFSALKNWINELDMPKTCEELKALLFPALCHLYIEMLNGGHHKDAIVFLRKHQQLSSEEGVELLEDLCQLDGTKDISEERVVTCLRSSRYQATLSSKSIHILKQYLTRKSHVILLQIINTWFDLEEAQPTDEIFIDLREEDLVAQVNGKVDESISDTVSGDSVDIAKIEETIKLGKDATTSPAPLLIYSVENRDENISCARISDDSSLLAVGYTCSTISLWSLTDEPLPQRRPRQGSRIRLAADPISDYEEEYIEPPNPFHAETKIELLGHTGGVYDTAFLPSSDFMVSVSCDKTMRAWNHRTYKCLSIYRGHNYPVSCVEASPLAGYVATGSHDRSARLWYLEMNFPLRIFAGHIQEVDCLRFHPNGNYLATGSTDKSIRLWSVDSGELVRVFEGHRGGIMALAFNPNGNQLASAGDDKRIKVWDVRNSGILGEFRGFSDCVVGLDWSPNTDYIASCSLDNTVKICPLKNILNDDEPSPTKFYQIDGNAMCSIHYSRQNSPMCVVGVKKVKQEEEEAPITS